MFQRGTSKESAQRWRGRCSPPENGEQGGSGLLEKVAEGEELVEKLGGQITVGAELASVLLVEEVKPLGLLVQLSEELDMKEAVSDDVSNC